jgi:tetratricopeptide (TPR) repeat protein
MRRTLVAAVILLSLAGLALGAEHALPDATQKAIAERNWPELVKLLRPLAKDPAHEPANYWLGAALYSTNKPKEAWQYLANAVKANPHCRPAAVMLARCVAACSLNDTFRIHNGLPAIKAFPFDAEVNHWIGRAWMNKYFFAQWYGEAGDAIKTRRVDYLKSAATYFRKAARSREDYAENARWHAFVLLRLGRHEEAVEAARRAAALGPVGWETHVVASSALTHLGRHAEAGAAYARAKRACPHLGKRVDFERGRALYTARRYNEACDAFKAAIRADKGYPFARHWLARAAVAAKNYGLAMWAIAESHNLDAQLIDDDYWAGRCAYGLGRYALAEKLIGHACDRARRHGARPGTPWVHYLGRAQWGEGKKAEAYKNLKAKIFEDKVFNIILEDKEK